MATKFKEFIREIEEEARAEGPEAIAQLAALKTHLRLGRQLAEARRAKKLSQAQVASLAGIDQADVSHIERGAANPTLNRLEAVATAIGLQIVLIKRRPPKPRAVRRSRSRKDSSKRSQPGQHTPLGFEVVGTPG